MAIFLWFELFYRNIYASIMVATGTKKGNLQAALQTKKSSA
jgi:hypothetical protein